MTELHEDPSFTAAKERNPLLWERIRSNPGSFRVLTGERPTGALHIGHFFGTLQNRLRLQELGVPIFLVIADYQALTDRDASARLRTSVTDIVLDYLAIGIDPARTVIFCHSYIPALNQLMLPFLSLISVSELERNPTVKSEIQSLGGKAVSALMYTYPVHQAADILSCHGSLVPGGKDQLPHVELTRVIARRFNERYCGGKPYFPETDLLLSDAPLLLGLDGAKMGKSLNNAVFIGMDADTTARLIRGAKTDSTRTIAYDPAKRPEVANLLLITSLCTGESPQAIADQIGDAGASALKQRMTEAVNEFFREIRQRRNDYAKNVDAVLAILAKGNETMQRIAAQTLRDVRHAMGMQYY